jgi:hypothetical protein
MDQDENSPWQYKPDDDQPAPDGPSNSGGHADSPKRPPAAGVSWEAAEFVDHPHGAGWYGALALGTVALAAIIFILSSKDVIATIFVLILGVIVGVFASHKPGTAKYEITSAGVSINGKLYRYADYKSFTVIHEGDLTSANLFPLKRFMPPIAAYFPKAEEAKITKTLGDHLPYEDRQLDLIDRLTRRMRL